MTGGGWPQTDRSIRGFTLIEVVVAIALLAIVVGPICGSLLALTSRAAAVSLESAVEVGSLETVDDAWRWSDVEIDDAQWDVATLNGVVRAAPGPDPIEIGWWIDGWYVGSVEDSRNGSFSVDPPLGGWPSGARWLTVRARRGSDPWGSAWRTALPTAPTEPGADSQSASAALLTIEPMDSASSGVVLHNPGAGPARVRLGSESAPALELPPEGATSLLVSSGVLDLYCDGALQSLTLENGDVVHLYF